MYKLDLLKRMENMILKLSYVLLINISSGNILRLNRVLLFLQESFVEKVKVNLFSNLTSKLRVRYSALLLQRTSFGLCSVYAQASVLKFQYLGAGKITFGLWFRRKVVNMQVIVGRQWATHQTVLETKVQTVFKFYRTLAS